MLGVSQPTLSAWEGERKNPSVESLIQMSELYGVSGDFLLGLPEARYHRADMLQPIPPEALPAFHDTPVFSSRYGWAMVNAIEGELLFASGMRLSLADVTEVYVLPPAFATLGAAVSMPLRRDELTGYDCVWVEPISMDAALRDELRGWYHIKRRFVENEVGQRFYKICFLRCKMACLCKRTGKYMNEVHLDARSEIRIRTSARFCP